MERTMHVKVAERQPMRERVLQCRRIRMREKLLTLLFGEKQQLAILIPGRTISEIDIKEIGERGEKKC